MSIKQTRRNFLKTSLVVVTGVSVGCSTSKDSRNSMLAKQYVSMTPEQAKAFRKKWQKENKIIRMPPREKKGSNGCWNIHMLGTCSGTQPMPDCNHTSWILERPDGELYWFDAGEYCSWTAHNMGLDVIRAKNLFISHPHGDHTLGLSGIFSVMGKMSWVYYNKVKPQLTIHASEGTMPAIRGAEAMATNGHKIKWLSTTELNEKWKFDDGQIVVDAIPNTHMPKRKGKAQSYSFRIKIPSIKKTLIFTGDIRSVDELAPFWKDGNIDILISEAGHVVGEKICSELKTKYPNAVKDIVFLHIATFSRQNIEFEKSRSEAVWGKPIIFAHDKQSIKIS